ncbi:hypothetical protein EWM64_g296 [Hericium alpestre]|uniref:Replication protein A C-terminal domain-containing protein n=1 Tax=Hericium alpestre TaxID=135208 RepID=A0A4Z0ABI9_9AGAM|nr:hypothetical protein EWM64_g296 [Hericium alpestre]
MSAALDRQIRPIYDAIDTGSNKSAILSCNKLLKKYPKNDLLKALKALALVRCQKVEESLALCDEVLASKPTDDPTLTAMMHVLRGLGRHADMVTMFEEAFKRQPTNEELGMQTFFANVRTGNWKAGQLLATKLNKQFHDERYIYWGIMCAVLQANDTFTPPNMRDILYKLAHRLASSTWKETDLDADRFYLYLSLLRELKLYDDARKLLESEQGKTICTRSLACNELRRDIWKLSGRLSEEGAAAEKRILEHKDRNWLEFLSVIDATFDASSDDQGELPQCIERILEFFAGIAENDGKADRSGPLALLELEKRARAQGLSTDPSRLVDLLLQYLEQFGDKPVLYEDLKPYIELEGDDLARWTSHLESLPHSTSSVQELQRSINVHKLLRYNLQPLELTVELEQARAIQLTQEYLEALQLGKDLPKTELQPADDLIILASQVFVNLYALSGDEAHLHNAFVILEFGAKRSPQSYQIHIQLILIYRHLGSPQPALEHYRLLNLKSVQNDTLSHLVLTRASMFSLAASGDLTYSSESLESSQIYMSNSQEVMIGNLSTQWLGANIRKTSDFIVRAFSTEKYSQIPDFIDFEDRLDNSLQRDLVKIEHVRMRLAHEPVNSELADMELIELKFIFDRQHHDNRDNDIIPNYQPRTSLSFADQTKLYGKEPGFGWLSIYLKAYIRAFQQASDLDDTVEEKLLIGDRPKQTVLAASRGPPLAERVAVRTPEEVAELTQDELAFFDYATDLANWLAPYHDHTRPPPATVLAEAIKQSEQKTGRPLRGIDIPAGNGHANGNGKKPEDAPAVTEPPLSLVAFFDSMEARFKGLVEQGARPNELLHAATIIQDALLLFVLSTVRFKNASVVKVNKTRNGMFVLLALKYMPNSRSMQLIQNFKPIRAKGLAVLKEVGAALVKVGESEGTADKRKAFVADCKALAISPEINHDYILEMAKKFTDGRKKRSELAQSLRPLTIKQLYSATQAHADADWTIENTEIGQVTVVAQVVSIQTQTTNSVYWLDDGTGRMEARFWSESTSQDDGDAISGVTENSYVRATGNLKTFGNKRYINALNIRPVKDFHEIFFHLAEAMGITMIFERGPPSGAGQAQPNGAGQPSASAYTAQSRGASSMDKYAHLPPLPRRIIEFILQQPPNPEGVHIFAITRSVGGDAAGISDALERLMDDGHIYSTIDEEHFNVSD